MFLHEWFLPHETFMPQHKKSFFYKPSQTHTKRFLLFYRLSNSTSLESCRRRFLILKKVIVMKWIDKMFNSPKINKQMILYFNKFTNMLHLIYLYRVFVWLPCNILQIKTFIHINYILTFFFWSC